MKSDNDVRLLGLFARDQRRRELSPATRYKARHFLERWAQWLPHPVAEATREDIESFLDSLHVEPRSRAAYLSHLRAFYRWATEVGEVEKDPAALVKRPKVRRTVPRPMSDADLHLAMTKASPMVRCWIALGAYAGLRVAEIAGLNRDDVLVEFYDHEGTRQRRAMLRVLGKGNKERIVPLHPVALAALDALPMPTSGALFRRLRCKDRYPAAQLCTELNAYLHDIGIQSTAHSLRHWFGTKTYQFSGADLRLVQELMGHDAITSTAVYTKVPQARSREVVMGLVLDGTIAS